MTCSINPFWLARVACNRVPARRGAAHLVGCELYCAQAQPDGIVNRISNCAGGRSECGFTGAQARHHGTID